MSDHAAPPADQLAPAGTWTVDPAASTVGWSVRHLGFTTVHGRFERFAGTLEAGEDGARAVGEVEAASLTSDNDQRDEYVRSAEFLDAAGHPLLTYRADAVTPSHQGKFEISGELTIRGATCPLVLFAAPPEAAGPGRVRVRAAGEVHRRDHGLRFPQGMGSADRTVGDAVAVEIDVVLVRDDD